MEWPYGRSPLLSPPVPEQAVPAGRAWCQTCQGTKKPLPGPCPLCGGTGHWGAEELRAYHARDPEACRRFCGVGHVEPDFTPLEERLRQLKAADEQQRRSDRCFRSIRVLWHDLDEG